MAADTSGTVFSIQSLDVPRDSAILGVGISVLSARTLQLYADLTAELSAGQRVHALGLGLRYQW